MKRSAGILLSVTSLPSRYGIGCFDCSAYRFVDWLAEAGQTYWQILPLGPTSYGRSADSPYQSYSAFAGNPYLISLEALIGQNLLTRAECDAVDFGARDDRVDYEKLHFGRYLLLRRAFERAEVRSDAAYARFVRDNAWWLDDFALFMALKNRFEQAHWLDWPAPVCLREADAMQNYRRELEDEIHFWQYLQYLFFTQWEALKRYANEKKIKIVGDIPIYLSDDSADVWAHPELFQLDETHRPIAVAGCPPDAFAETGQLWGNPLYRWDYHRDTGYSWWIARLRHSFRLYDRVRIDHFRGFDEYYAIPYGNETAEHGHWEAGPGMELFRAAQQQLGECPVIAEDLGLITPSVRELVRQTGFPNMKVLEFAFDPDDRDGRNDYLPHNHPMNCVVYTGTHDNETLCGWLAGLPPRQLQMVRDYLCDEITPTAQLYRPMVALAMHSRANGCILPLQDCLGLGNDCRMNTPSTVGENWRWRLKPGQCNEAAQRWLLRLTQLSGRSAG